MEETGCEIICGAPMTLAVKEQMMMMMMTMTMCVCVRVCVCVFMFVCLFECVRARKGVGGPAE